MLKKRLRLRAAEVEEVLKKGHSARSTYMQIKVLSKEGGLKSAAVVPKSLARKANKRNALRRAIYRALAATPTPSMSSHAVFFIRVIPKEDTARLIKEEVSLLLSKVRL